MKEQPLISIIIPCYNYDAFLATACDSIVCQSYSNWECILVNNGRFPKTKVVAQKFVNSDSRFIYIESDKLGPSSARNEGLRLSKGQWIQFLDADDKIAAGRFETLITKILATSCDLLYSNVLYFTNENPDHYKSELDGLSNFDKQNHKGTGRILYNLLLKSNVFVINAPLFHRSLLNGMNGFDERLDHLEDWSFWLQLAQNVSHFEFVNDVNAQVYVRRHSNSLSRNSEKMRLSFIPILLNNLNVQKASWATSIARLAAIEEKLWDSFFIGRYIQVLNATFLLLKDKSMRVFFGLMNVLLLLFLPFYLLIKLVRLIKK